MGKIKTQDMTEDDMIRVIETDRLYFLDRLQIIASMFDDHVCSHEFAKKNATIRDLAYEALHKMADLYKTAVSHTSSGPEGDDHMDYGYATD